MRILRVLQGRSLRCGCFVGIYETYDGETISIVDEPGRACREAAHLSGRAIRPGDPADWRANELRVAGG